MKGSMKKQLIIGQGMENQGLTWDILQCHEVRKYKMMGYFKGTKELL